MSWSDDKIENRDLGGPTMEEFEPTAEPIATGAVICQI